MSKDSEGRWESSPGTVFDSNVENVCRVVTASPGPRGQLPITAEDLLGRPSGDIFGWTQDVGMGWNPAQLRRPEVLILSTQGGIRLPDGTPLALGYHTGHYDSKAASLSPVIAQTHATVGRKGRRACSTVSLIATTRRWSCVA